MKVELTEEQVLAAMDKSEVAKEVLLALFPNILIEQNTDSIISTPESFHYLEDFINGALAYEVYEQLPGAHSPEKAKFVVGLIHNYIQTLKK